MKQEPLPDRANAYRRKYNAELRAEIYHAYGGKCACCGESDWHFLTVEHIGGIPDRHRSASGKRAGPQQILLRLKADGFPDYVELLCWNCNEARKMWGGCPHQCGPVRYLDGEVLLPELPELKPFVRLRKTHCSRGHEYTTTNSSGWQTCQICHNEARRRRRAKKQSAGSP